MPASCSGEGKHPIASSPYGVNGNHPASPTKTASIIGHISTGCHIGTDTVTSSGTGTGTVITSPGMATRGKRKVPGGGFIPLSLFVLPTTVAAAASSATSAYTTATVAAASSATSAYTTATVTASATSTSAASAAASVGGDRSAGSDASAINPAECALSKATRSMLSPSSSLPSATTIVTESGPRVAPTAVTELSVSVSNSTCVSVGASDTSDKGTAEEIASSDGSKNSGKSDENNINSNSNINSSISKTDEYVSPRKLRRQKALKSARFNDAGKLMPT
jgi:hypothetical protein